MGIGLLVGSTQLERFESAFNHTNWAAVAAIAACLSALFSLIITLSERGKDRARRKPRLYVSKSGDPAWLSGLDIDLANIQPINLKIHNAGIETLYDISVTLVNKDFFSSFRKFEAGGALQAIGARSGLSIADSNDSFILETREERYQASKRQVPVKNALFSSEAVDYQVAKPYTQLLIKYLELMSEPEAARLPPSDYIVALDDAPSITLAVNYRDMYNKAYSDTYQIASQLSIHSPGSAATAEDIKTGHVSFRDMSIVLSVTKQ